MGYRYRLQINHSEPSEVSRILEVKSRSNVEGLWSVAINDPDTGPAVDFIGEFLGMLDGRYDALQEIGVRRKDITVWFYYEYEEQCNMEFHPDELERLGRHGLTLCISCWERGATLSFESPNIDMSACKFYTGEKEL